MSFEGGKFFFSKIKKKIIFLSKEGKWMGGV
jgi:hypothetical protein